MEGNDLSTFADEELCALEGFRALPPDEWRRIDDELRRRRRARVPGLTKLPGGPPPETMPTLGDLERVSTTLVARLAASDRQVRRLRWWVLLSPLFWLLAAMGLLAAYGAEPAWLQQVHWP